MNTTIKNKSRLCFCFMQTVIQELKEAHRHRTAENYAAARNSFMRFRANTDVMLSEIDGAMMMRYEAFLWKSGYSSIHLTKKRENLYL